MLSRRWGKRTKPAKPGVVARRGSRPAATSSRKRMSRRSHSASAMGAPASDAGCVEARRARVELAQLVDAIEVETQSLFPDATEDELVALRLALFEDFWTNRARQNLLKESPWTDVLAPSRYAPRA